METGTDIFICGSGLINSLIFRRLFFFQNSFPIFTSFRFF